MKKNLFYLLLCTFILALSSCSDDNKDEYLTYEMTVQLVYPDTEHQFAPIEGIKVTLTNEITSVVNSMQTDATGKAVFTVPSGVYTASATDIRSYNGRNYTLGGSKSNAIVNNQNASVGLDLVISETKGIVIKELYVGGCPTDDNSGAYKFDQYVILYNNSSEPIDISDVTLAMVMPYNGHASNNDYGTDGKLYYEAEGWIPAGMAVWSFTNNVVLESGKQIAIALNNAVNNTVTYSQSVNFANPDYYCTYDPTAGFTHTSYYSAPSELVPTSHYLKATKFATGTAWALSQLSPAFFIFIPEGQTVESFVANVSSTTNDNIVRKKVPVDWIVDGVEVFKGDATNKKRLTSAVDAGAVAFIGMKGYTVYRNVDVEATKAIDGNSAKLVYSYAFGTDTTDPSGIDAEASISNGARIVYKDTNNSTNDFHQRAKASLRR